MDFKSDYLHPKFTPKFPINSLVLYGDLLGQVVDFNTDARVVKVKFNGGVLVVCGYECVTAAPLTEDAIKQTRARLVLDSIPPPIPEAAPTSQGKGMKFDGDKNRLDLLIMGMPETLEGISRVLTFGARKYAADSWQHVEDGIRRYEGAAMRHKLARLKGEWLDPESGEPHIYHELCCTMFIAQLHEIQSKENTNNVQ